MQQLQQSELSKTTMHAYNVKMANVMTSIFRHAPPEQINEHQLCDVCGRDSVSSQLCVAFRLFSPGVVWFLTSLRL